MQNSSSILNVCLEAIWYREATIENCIRRYPEIAELGTLLRSAVAVRELPKVVLAPNSREKLRQQMLSRFDARPANKPALRGARQLRRWLRPVIAVIVTLVVIFSGSASLIHAASSAVPGDTLYGVKRAVEEFQLSLADGESRVAMLEQIANTRLDEVAILVARNASLPDPVLNDVSTSVTQALKAELDAGKRDSLLARAASVIDQAEQAGAINTVTGAKVITAISGKPSSDATFPPQKHTPEPTTLITTLTLNPTSTPSATLPNLSATPTISNSNGNGVKPTKNSPIKPTHRPTKIPNQNGNNGNNGGNGNGNNNGHGK